MQHFPLIVCNNSLFVLFGKQQPIMKLQPAVCKQCFPTYITPYNFNMNQQGNREVQTTQQKLILKLGIHQNKTGDLISGGLLHTLYCRAHDNIEHSAPAIQVPWLQSLSAMQVSCAACQLLCWLSTCQEMGDPRPRP